MGAFRIESVLASLVPFLFAVVISGCGDDINADLFDPPERDLLVQEEEPNDNPILPQDLGTLKIGETVTVKGAISKTGLLPYPLGDADSDVYLVSTPESDAPMVLHIELEWDVDSNFDMIVMPLDDSGMPGLDMILDGATLANPEQVEMEVEPEKGYDLWLMGMQGDPGSYSLYVTLEALDQ